MQHIIQIAPNDAGWKNKSLTLGNTLPKVSQICFLAKRLRRYLHLPISLAHHEDWKHVESSSSFSYFKQIITCELMIFRGDGRHIFNIGKSHANLSPLLPLFMISSATLSDNVSVMFRIQTLACFQTEHLTLSQNVIMKPKYETIQQSDWWWSPSWINIPSSVKAGAVSRYCRILRSFSNGHSTFFQVMNSLTCLASSQNFWIETENRRYRLIIRRTQRVYGSVLHSVRPADLTITHLLNAPIMTVTLPLSKAYNPVGLHWTCPVTYYTTRYSVNVFKCTVEMS